MKFRITTFLFATLLFPPLEAVELSANPAISTTGTITLHWQGDGAPRFELEQSSQTLGTHTIYQGGDTARVMTGLPNGKYSYRVRAIKQEVPGPWSRVHSVSVRHHPLSRAFAFFGIGLLVFLATLTLVLRGARD